jgi:polyvinyl alcohol dehydrogenase (cytochrome)
LWQRIDPRDPSQNGGGPSGPTSVANGVVFGCSLDADGYMYAMNAATGAELWNYKSGGSCLSGAAIVDGVVYWGSGYSNFGFGTPNNKLYAFGLPQ